MGKQFLSKQPDKQIESSGEYKDGGVSLSSFDKGTKNALLAIFAGTTLTGCFGAPTMPSAPEPSRPEATPPPPTQEFTPGFEHVVDPRDIKSISGAVELLKTQSPDKESLKAGEGYSQEIRSAQITDKAGNMYLLVEYDLKLGPTYKGFSSPDGTGSLGVIFIDRDNKYMSAKQYPNVTAPHKNEAKQIQEFFLTAIPSSASAKSESAIDIQFTSNPDLIGRIDDLQNQGALNQIIRRSNAERTIVGKEIVKPRDVDVFMAGATFSDPDQQGLALVSRYQPVGEKPGFAFFGSAAPILDNPGVSPYRR